MVDSASPAFALILVDGLGYDFVSPQNTPNLAKWAESYPLKSVRPILGYSDSQRVALFTGLPPDKSGYWMLYHFASPQNSPWSKLGLFRFMDNLPGEFPRKAFKFGLSSSLLRVQARVGGYDDLNIHNIPFRLLPWFAPTLRTSVYAPDALGNVPTIFDSVRAASRKFGIVRSDTVSKYSLLRSVDTQLERLLQAIRNLDEDTAFLYFYLHTPDMFAHRNGIRSQRFFDEVQTADSALEKIVSEIRERLGQDTQIVVVSDHGMNQSETFVSFQHLVNHSSAGKDFVVALDSTMIRFWYLTPEGRTIGKTLLEKSDIGHFLTNDERRELNIDFPGDHYGDDIYLLRLGFSIYPNFHSLLKPLAMHAYHPDEPDQQAMALFLGDKAAESVARFDKLDMTDIHTIAMSSLSLDS